MRIRHSIFFVGLTLLLSLSVTFAQDAACTTLVQQALTGLGDYCDQLDRNSACYGFNRLDATFAQTQPDGYFSHTSDRAGLEDLQSVQSAPLNVATQQWGLAVMNVQANLPNTLPGQAVVMILVGDTSVTNDVSADEAQTGGTPVQVTTASAANIRSGPSSNTNIATSVASGTALMADGVSQDGSWLRISYQDTPGWISRSLVNTEGDLSSLPAITSESRSPMQAFTFHTGIGQPSCASVPPSLLVLQGPHHISVNLTVNGAEMRFGSTIIVWQTGPDEISAAVLDGTLVIDGLVVPPGFMIKAKIDPATGKVVGGWGDFQAMPPDLLQQLHDLELIPADLLHYPITVPTEGDIQAFIASQNTQPGPESTAEAIGAVGDCGGFVGTSPTEGMPYGPVSFYWAPLAGAASYRVNVFNGGGAQVASYDSAGAATHVSGNMASAGGGFVFSWNVQAFDAAGNLLCTTNLITELRSSAPPPHPPSTGPVCGNTSCEPGENYYTCPSDCGFG
jgi:SH3 domain-containing protein